MANNTYLEIIELKPELYSTYLIRQINNLAPDPNYDYTSQEGALILGNKLVEISALFSEMTSLLSLIIPKKREANRTGDKIAYQDYIDKEAVTEDLLKALDMRYKAINRLLTVRDSNLRELFMTKGT